MIPFRTSSSNKDWKKHYSKSKIFIRNGKHSDIERALSAFLIPSTKISETQRNL
jgi:hypothetical protein